MRSGEEIRFVCCGEKFASWWEEVGRGTGVTSLGRLCFGVNEGRYERSFGEKREKAGVEGLKEGVKIGG